MDEVVVWTFKRAGFKVYGVVAYSGYFFGEFAGYFYNQKQYTLTQKGEKFCGHRKVPFTRVGDITWEQWKELVTNN